MSAACSIPARAFAVWFHELERWDPASFHGIAWHWPPTVMHRLGSVLKVRKDKVNRATVKFSDLQPITIHFDGSIDKREVDAGREYTMDLFYAKPEELKTW
jgi:type I restriction enzyme S subunit